MTKYSLICVNKVQYDIINTSVSIEEISVRSIFGQLVLFRDASLALKRLCIFGLSAAI